MPSVLWLHSSPFNYTVRYSSAMAYKPKTPAVNLPPTGALAQRRAGIVQAARSAFLDHGYEGASMERIASTAGVTKKTLYNHFPGKESLFAAVVASLCGEISDSLKSSDRQPDNLAQGLIRFGQRFIALMATSPGLEVFRLAITMNKRFPDFGQTLYMAGTAHVVSTLADYIELHAADAPAIAPLQLARQLIGSLSFLVQSALLGARIQPGSEETDGYIHDAVHTLLAGADRQSRRNPR